MAHAKLPVIAFDLYGTILSTDSITSDLAEVFGEKKASDLATLWRRYQLEYTWQASSMNEYAPFGAITRAALQHAAAEMGLSDQLSDDDVERLMTAYDALRVWPDVPAALQMVKENPNAVEACIFSNGEKRMLDASVSMSPDLQPYREIFRDIVTVNSVRSYKPAHAVYTHLHRELSRTKDDAPVWLVTSNPFDIVGARHYGMHAAFVDRAGKGWIDRLGGVLGHLEPTVVVRGVDEAVMEILKRAKVVKTEEL